MCSNSGYLQVTGVHFEEFLYNISFLGALAKLRKETIDFVMSVRSSVRLSTWNNSAPTGRIFMKFDAWGCIKNLSIKFKFH
jgi:hypothetical protein